VSAVDLRCSAQARGARLDPLGTAGSYDGFVLVEVPLPWPKEITDHPSLAGIGSVVPDGFRVQGLVPSPELLAAGQTLVVEHRRAAGHFTGYERREVLTPLGGVIGAIAAVAAQPVEREDTVDLLVCTHGQRDRCCGSLGVGLFSNVRERPGQRTWRTSHTGGHRFAPTAVVLPHGTVWAWLDDALLDAVLDRSRPPAALMGHYRGSPAMPSPAAQIVEGAVFAEVGWSWVDAGRTGTVVDRVDDRTVVRIDSTVGAWEGVVEQTGWTVQPVCGVADPPKPKRDPVLRLVSLRREP
jgi:hypothetical protein